MRKVFYIVFFFFVQLTCLGQIELPLKKVAQEQVFVHLNTSFLITGETLYYKIYCINSETNKLSGLSKISYVELVDASLNVVAKSKVRLNQGCGYGDFFIPTSLASGSYKLLAFTRWMRNENLLYEHDVLIINPFIENQFENKKNKESTDNFNSESATIQNKINPIFSLELPKTVYQPRKEVKFKVKSLTGLTMAGRYSVSVKKKLPFKVPKLKTSVNYSDIYKNNNGLKEREAFLPEFRGELIEGVLVNQVTGEPVSSRNIALSIPGKTPLFKNSFTNQNGQFFFNILDTYNSDSALVYTLGTSNEAESNLEIKIKNDPQMDYSFLAFRNLDFDENDESFLLNEVINNQIENSYLSVKRTIIQDEKPPELFYGSEVKDYYLDDYKRFATLKETFVEVIENAWIAKRNNDHYFETKKDTKKSDYRLPTLLFMDGILIEEHKDIIEYKAYDIEKISVLIDRYIYGSLMFDGLISIKTKNGDYKKPSGSFKEIKLTKPVSNKVYYRPDYSKPETNKRIPDYRSQLLWEPNLELKADNQYISFFTSDNLGDYIINVEGFTHDGAPVSIKKEISIE
ncbi:hypothetical protein [Algibacter mikhailovii]|nr:hypothetical protein [Algibacter mikhailovii]